jgi:hypothetical protein
MNTFSSLVIVIRDMVNIADDSISSFCDVLAYQNGELLDAESASWKHLDSNRVLDSFFL